MDAIRNFVAIDATYATGGQPTEDQLKLIARSGYEVVLNLGLLDPKYCLPDEAGAVARLNLHYEHIPVDFQNPTLEDFYRFRDALLGARPRKVFIHCAANYRASCFIEPLRRAPPRVALRANRTALPPSRAPNETWTRFFDRTRVALRSEV